MSVKCALEMLNNIKILLNNSKFVVEQTLNDVWWCDNLIDIGKNHLLH